MKTVCEISEDANPCRDIVEGRTKLRTVRTVPARDFVCQPAPSDELPTVELPSARIVRKYSRQVAVSTTEAA